MDSTPIRVRIAPSPTGDPHIGTAYIALFNYVFAKKHKGSFIIRIEDTDRQRLRPGVEEMLYDCLKWLGLEWSEGPDRGGPHGPYRQSERLDIYRTWVNKLVNSGHAYPCFCTPQRLDELRKIRLAQKLPPGYDGRCRDLPKEEAEKRMANHESHTIRMRVPLEGKTSFKDGLRGHIEFENALIDDQVILKSDGFPTYHLANVVDDHLMKISHVIRGEEWISSTPKHVLLYNFLNLPLPQFIHLPLLRNSDKSKISKRRNPTSIAYYRRKGILPEALRNFLALMGWSYGENTEIFSTESMIERFETDHLHLGGPVFDLQKLSWLNGHYIRNMGMKNIIQHLQDHVFSKENLEKIVPLIQERIEKFEDFIDHTSFFFSGDLNISAHDILPAGQDPKVLASHFESLLESLDTLYPWKETDIHNRVTNYLKEKSLKPKQLLLPIRMATTGSLQSPPLFATLETLGKEMVRRRLRLAVDSLKRLENVP